MGGLRDKAIKELKDQIAAKQREVGKAEKKNFWETSGFKVVSMSMLILVVFSKR